MRRPINKTAPGADGLQHHRAALGRQALDLRLAQAEGQVDLRQQLHQDADVGGPVQPGHRHRGNTGCQQRALPDQAAAVQHGGFQMRRNLRMGLAREHGRTVPACPSLLLGEGR
jgi:hypothetical protein